MKIIPTILTAEVKKVKKKLQLLSGISDVVQLDITDGRFVNNKTINLDQLVTVAERKKFKIDLHLMVENPLQLIKTAKDLGFKRFIAHAEAVVDQKHFVDKVLSFIIEPGLALAIDSPVSTLKLEVLPLVKVVLLMSIKTGYSGQKFNDKALVKIKTLNKIKKDNNFNFEICVDGGINDITAKSCFIAGADSLAVNNYLWQAKDTKKNYFLLQSIS